MQEQTVLGGFKGFVCVCAHQGTHAQIPEEDAILLGQAEHHAESIAEGFLLNVDVASSYQSASITARKLTRPSSRLQY
jgi:hypothetical protein